MIRHLDIEFLQPLYLEALLRYRYLSGTVYGVEQSVSAVVSFSCNQCLMLIVFLNPNNQ